MVAQIDPEKHHQRGHLLAARSRGLSFCSPMVRAGQALRLLAESSVPGAVRGDGQGDCISHRSKFVHG